MGVTTYYSKNLGTACGAGDVVNHYNVKLTNTTIVYIKSIMLNKKNQELSRYTGYKEIAFTYQKIAWLCVQGGITASDEWEAAVV